MTDRTPSEGSSWWLRRARSFVYAWRGLAWMFRSQPNAQIHLLAAIASTALGVILRISRLEWCAIVGVIGFVLTAEALNSAIEALADRVSPEIHPLVGRAKDVAAAAVLIAALAATVVGLLVFGPKLVGQD